MLFRSDLVFQVTLKSLELLLLFGTPTFIIFAQIFRLLIVLPPTDKETKAEDTEETGGEAGASFRSLDQPGTLVKLLAMFIGELTFDEMVEQLEPQSVRYFAGLLVFAFAFVATIVLLNLLLAFAVSITSEMESKAATDVARCQLRQIHFWETFHLQLLRVGEVCRRAWTCRRLSRSRRQANYMHSVVKTTTSNAEEMLLDPLHASP